MTGLRARWREKARRTIQERALDLFLGVTIELAFGAAISACKL